MTNRADQAVSDAERLMAEFRQGDLNNHEWLIRWIKSVVKSPANDYHSPLPWDEIASTLEANGYRKNANVGEEFREFDSGNVAHWLVGQVLEMLRDHPGLGLHEMLEMSCDNWLRRFAAG